MIEKMQSDPVALFTALVAAFTALLFLATYMLAWIAFRQRKDSRIAQRAYLAAEPLGIYLMVEGDRVIGHIGIRNAGRLPARKVSWFINMRQSEKGNEKVFPLQKPKGSIIIPPGAVTRRGSDIHIFLEKLISAAGEGKERNQENDVYLYVWGVLRYKDGFRLRKRFTKFCHRYNWRIRRGNEIAEKYARYHEYGNDAN